jgi:D-amino-acid dehydrogenase
MCGRLGLVKAGNVSIPRIAIVGAGIIGLGVAVELVWRGACVTIIDPRNPGAAASGGNTGWIVPTLSAPVPAPGLPAQVARWMVKSDAPFRIDLLDSAKMLPWLWSFWRNCRTDIHRRGLLSQGRLNARAFDGFRRWRQSGINIELHESGVTFVSEHLDAIQHVADELELLTEFGYEPAEYLDRGRLVSSYPELGTHAQHGYVARREQFVRPESVIQSLVDLLSNSNAAMFRRERVERAHQSDSGIKIRMSGGEVVVDDVVIAAGAWSGAVGTLFGVDLPVEAGKGYSITVEEPVDPLTGPLYLADAKIACTPFPGANRFAGMMELTTPDEVIDPERVLTMTRLLDRFLLGWGEGKRRTVWAGSRPMTPDGLPMIGRIPGNENVFAATGHGMLGVTMAPLTGECIADMIINGREDDDLDAFRVDRFSAAD